jgi:hypothetical protein
MRAGGRHSGGAILLTMALVLFGLGHLLPTGAMLGYDDPQIVSRWLHGNSLSGWRPDLGFGQSVFFSDPGSQHPWSPLGLLEAAIPNDGWLFTATVVGLCLIAALGQLLLNRACGASPLIASLLAPLVVLGPLLDKFLTQRLWITQLIGTSLLTLAIARFSRRPDGATAWLFALGMFVVVFFGTIPTWLGTMQALLLFAVVHAVALRGETLAALLRSGVLMAVGAAAMAALGAFAFYSIIVEGGMVAYVRDTAPFRPDPAADTAWMMAIRTALNGLIDIFHTGWLGRAANFPGLQHLHSASAHQASLAFPILLAAALLLPSRSPLERAVKATAALLYLNDLVPFLPFILGTLLSVARLVLPFIPPADQLRLISVPAGHVFQVATLAIFVGRVGEWGMQAEHPLARLLRRVTAAPILLFHAGLVALWLAMALVPGDAARLMGAVLDRLPLGGRRDEAMAALDVAVEILHREMDGRLLLYFLLQATLALVLLHRPSTLRLGRGAGLALLLLATSIACARVTAEPAPLPMVWADAPGLLRPWDRAYQVEIQGGPGEKSAEYFRRNWLDPEFGLANLRAGYPLVPSLNLSMVKSFTPAEATTVVRDTAGADGAISAVRRLYNGPLVHPGLFDLAGVSHYFSARPLPPREGLTPIHRSQGLFVYRNEAAWPHAYLAARALPYRSGRDLDTATRGDVFLAPDEAARQTTASEGRVDTLAFEPGHMRYRVESDAATLLVVSDGWHPLWRASIDGQDAPVLKANGIFKAVALPAGSHVVEFRFDTARYRPGIWLAATAWALFAALGVALLLRRSA